MSLVLPVGVLACRKSTQAAITTTETNIAYELGSNKLPLGALQPGSTIAVQAWGYASASSAGSIRARIHAGTANSTADGTVADTGATGIGSFTTAVGWHLEGIFTVYTTGSGGTCIGEVELQVGGNTTNRSAQSATTAINTTIDNFLNVSLLGGGTSPSISVVQGLLLALRGG
jgi:hypothetical protein